MIFANTQDLILGEGPGVLGLSHTTVTFLGFAGGALLIFAVATQRNITAISKLSAVLIAIGAIARLLLPGDYSALAGETILMSGVGGCVSASSFSFVFLLNNAERFFSAAFMILLIKLVEVGALPSGLHPTIQIGLALLLLLPLCLCMFFSKTKNYEGAGDKAVKRFDASIGLTLFLLLSYFAIRITGFYAPAFGHPASAQLWGLLAFTLLLGCVILQALLRRSIWTLCNVFFLSSILSYGMWYIKAPEAAYLFSELKEIGFLTAFYLIGCVTNKFCDFRMHKRLVLMCMAAVGLLYIGVDALHAKTLDQPVAFIAAALLFVVFLLLSPAFSQYLFFAKWSEEFRRVRMSPLAEDMSQTGIPGQAQPPSLDDTKLSPREKQVALLLLRGMTLRQVAPVLGLTPSTVSTYAKTIYKKLNINSRAELFLLFGGRETIPPQDGKE